MPHPPDIITLQNIGITKQGYELPTRPISHHRIFKKPGHLTQLYRCISHIYLNYNIYVLIINILEIWIEVRNRQGYAICRSLSGIGQVR